MAALKGYFFPRVVAEEGPGDHTPGRATMRALTQVLSPLPVLQDNTTFQVFVMGSRGAGKTVFLASLFHLMSTQTRTGNNFILSCSDPKSLNQLRSIFSEISNPKKGWPPGTYGSQEYIFDCEHIKDKQRINLFKFRYFDFPGGYINEGKSENDLAFVLTQAKNANSILVLLDGKKIRNLLENHMPPEGEPTIYDDLDMMSGILQQSVGKPLHFAITKSDILDPETHSLARIKDALLLHNGFRDLTDQNDRDMYLLPVSAVGKNFAKFDPVEQEMKKRPDGRIEPLQVDMSLTFTLVDHLKRLSSELKKQIVDGPEKTAVRKWLWQGIVQYAPALPAFALGPLVNHVGENYWKAPTIPFHIQFIIGATVFLALTILLNVSGAKIKRTFEAWQNEMDSKDRRSYDRHQALETILKNQILRSDRFERKYPDAKLASDESFDR